MRKHSRATAREQEFEQRQEPEGRPDGESHDEATPGKLLGADTIRKSHKTRHIGHQ